MDNLISEGLMLEGLTLMVFGMGAVFAFLILLVLATSAMSRAIALLEPAPTTDLSHSSDPLEAADRSFRASDQHAVDGQTLAIITAAIHQHRQSKKHT